MNPETEAKMACAYVRETTIGLEALRARLFRVLRELDERQAAELPADAAGCPQDDNRSLGTLARHGQEALCNCIDLLANIESQVGVHRAQTPMPLCP